MSPRALTPEEKCRQCEKLIQVGKTLVMQYGLNKISIDDIIKKAGIAKGSFYNHFANKEQFLVKVVWDIYQSYLDKAQNFITTCPPDSLSSHLKTFVLQLFSMPETEFFFQAETELSELFSKLPQDEMMDYAQMEKATFTKLVYLMGADITKVNPDVVHNYMHTLYFMNSSNMMIKEAVSDTFHLMLDSLIGYIFGGENV